MKKRILVLLGILIIGGAGAGVCWKLGFFDRQEESKDMAYVTEISQLLGQVSGVTNRYAGVVEPRETVEVELENGRAVKEVKVKTGDEVKQGQLLFEYDLSSIQEDLAEAQLDFDRLVNEAASLKEQIATLEKEKKSAKKDDQLSYTIEIETNKMNLKKNEYSQKSKQAEITKLQNTMGNTEVRSSIDGVIQKIDTSKMTTEDGSTEDYTSDDFGYSDSGSGNGSNAFITILSTGAYRVKGTINEMNANSIIEGDPVIIRSRVDENQIWKGTNAFITILSTGAYRVKGTINEMNANSIIEGDPVIIRSRVDENQIWKGTMGSVDRDSANSQNNDASYMWGMTAAGDDSQTTSSTYPFYVNLESSEGMMQRQGTIPRPLPVHILSM